MASAIGLRGEAGLGIPAEGGAKAARGLKGFS
jgi:hypothetical protein